MALTKIEQVVGEAEWSTIALYAVTQTLSVDETQALQPGTSGEVLPLITDVAFAADRFRQ